MQVTQQTHQNNDTSFTRKLLIFSCFLFTSFCFWKVGVGLIGDADTEILPSAHATMSPSISPPRVVTTPIQQMRPGMRVVGRNPLRRETEATIDPTPEGWRLVSVQMRKEDGTYFEAELLRPLSWIRRHQAQPGAVIGLNMPELHVVGAAEVLAVSACPPIDPGDGPVVLSTFKNVAKKVLNIYVEGEAEPTGVTAGHPIWSEDRQAFIHSDQLQPGERLRSAVGRTVRITSIEIRAGPEPVYNLEVAGEHVYSVTDSGLLVHNTGPCDLNLNAPRASAATEAHNAANYERYKLQLLAEEIANPGDRMSGAVIVDRFNSPKVTTAAQEAQLREYASLSTLAEREGYLSPTGRVSTAGAIEREAARARVLERRRAALAGTPYDSNVAAHAPDSGWLGYGDPPFWLSTERRVNATIAGQQQRYPIGYKPTRFIFRGDLPQ